MTTYFPHIDSLQGLSSQQKKIISELLEKVAPDFSRSITKMLEERMQHHTVKNPTAFVRYHIQAVRQGRFGPNKGLIIRRAKMATSGADRQSSGNGQGEG